MLLFLEKEEHDDDETEGKSVIKTHQPFLIP